MKIFDCVTFFQENLAMKLRFNILNNVVHKFIVCEGKQNHKGKKKKINFNIDNFPNFKSKIIHIICDDFPSHLNPWQRQAFQREKIFDGLGDARNNDLILFSDPDEIPNPIKLKNIKIKKKYLIFLQKMFYYKLNLQDINLGSNWEGTRGCLKKNLKSIDYMRQKVVKKNSRYYFWRFDKEKNFELINNGGWHFSYLLKPKDIKKKIETFAHYELNKHQFTNMKNIKNSINNSKDLFNRPIFFQKVEIDNTYPNFILKNLDKLKHWIA